MTDPTPTDLKARFPAFASVPDAALAGALAEARARIDAGTGGDLARLLYAAHVLTLDGFGGAEGAWQRAGRPLLLRSGTLEVRRRDDGPDPSDSLGETSYGRRLRDLLGHLSPGIAVV
ncbi:DUF4054 domain-containing protein [Methylobacterium sp. JK268]